MGQLLAQAAVMAKRAGSYQNGLIYARVSQYLIGVDPVNPLVTTDDESKRADAEQKLDDDTVHHRWEFAYPLSLLLATERGELEYLCGHMRLAERELEFALKKSEVLLDRAKVHQQLLNILTSASRFAEAISNTRQALIELGQCLPLRETDMSDEQRARAASLSMTYDNLCHLPCTPAVHDMIYAELLRRLEGRPVASLIDLPRLFDPQQSVVTSLLTGLLPAAFASDPLLFPALCYIMVIRAMNVGVTGEETYALASVGLLRQSNRHDLVNRLPQQYGSLAMALQEKHQVAALKARTLIANAMWLQHWTLDPAAANEVLHASHSGCIHTSLDYAWAAVDSELTLRPCCVVWRSWRRKGYRLQWRVATSCSARILP